MAEEVKEADWKCAHVPPPISRPRHVLYVLAGVFGDFMRFFSETDVLVISSLCGIRDSVYEIICSARFLRDPCPCRHQLNTTQRKKLFKNDGPKERNNDDREIRIKVKTTHRNQRNIRVRLILLVILRSLERYSNHVSTTLCSSKRLTDFSGVTYET